MTGLDRTFSKVTLEEKKDRRTMHQELRKRFNSALGDLATVKNVSSANHTDPHAALDDLQTVLEFSSIPGKYRIRKAANATGQAESIVKQNMRNEAYDGVMAQRSASVGGADVSGDAAAAHVVDMSRPLTLSFESRRARIMKAHTSKVESSLCGLFSRNVNGEAQGPVPDLYTPPPTSRRNEIEKQKQEARERMIKAKGVSKEALLVPPHIPQLHGLKVAKDFVPSCLRLDHGNGKVEAQQRAADRQSKIIGSTPFK
ncbi:Hypothetical protein, putative [Bodo saltans]|uniref:Uncharacterized protein n=1 Tax=Bodo saltans TaxID=75058 RepID=A0A0S4IQX3_BODSA|nr:Hypothetical protein, putative [Bodo saltans]|eukprot:CUF98877.1 Hypothetical protein, putative [Bodo saltans]